MACIASPTGVWGGFLGGNGGVPGGHVHGCVRWVKGVKERQRKDHAAGVRGTFQVCLVNSSWQDGGW